MAKRAFSDRLGLAGRLFYIVLICEEILKHAGAYAGQRGHEHFLPRLVRLLRRSRDRIALEFQGEALDIG